MRFQYFAAFLALAVLFASTPAWAHPKGARDVNDADSKTQLYRESSSGRMLFALTFDDGPRASTSQLLEILDQLNVRATFFVCGSYCEAAPDGLRAIAAARHEIGNHSYSHPAMARLDDAQIAWQLDETNATIRSIIGRTPRVFRPPYGNHNQRVLDAATDRNMKTVMWSVDPSDYDRISATTLANRVLDRVGPGGIVLFHEGHARTREALPLIVEGLRERGYSFVTVSELLGLTNTLAYKIRRVLEGNFKPEEWGVL